jgi:molybdate transport system substrate-binding protein
MMKKIVLFCLCLLLAGTARAGEVDVAVAANFAKPFAAISNAFTQATGHTVVVSIGSTGKLYAQIHNGAPFQVFLAADTRRPDRLVAEGLAVAGSERTYAIGQLVLWSPGLDVSGGAQALTEPSIHHVAIANPKTAPYGAAAMQALEHLGLTAAVQPKLVAAENIAQVFQFVASGNAEAGFVAASQLKGGRAPGGSLWLVPDGMHDPIEQGLCLLKAGAANPAARALVRFMASGKAAKIIGAFGYGVPRR